MHFIFETICETKSQSLSTDNGAALVIGANPLPLPIM